MQTQTPLSEPFTDEHGYCLFGAEMLVDRIKELENQTEGAKKNDDIEYIHKLRVASRRVRTALNIFEECFPKKQIKKWNKTIKNVTTSSGAARDADVLIAFLESYSTQADPRAARGLDYLISMQKAGSNETIHLASFVTQVISNPGRRFVILRGAWISDRSPRGSLVRPQIVYGPTQMHGGNRQSRH